MKTITYHCKEIMGFIVHWPESYKDQVTAGLLSLLLAQKYPALTFRQIKEKHGGIITLRHTSLLTIQSIEP